MTLLDSEQLAVVYDLAGEQLGGFLAEFEDSSREGLQQMGAQLGQSNLAAAETAHQLKGAAASLGMAAFQSRVGQAEERLRAGAGLPSGELESMMSLMEASLQEARARLATG